MDQAIRFMCILTIPFRYDLDSYIHSTRRTNVLFNLQVEPETFYTASAVLDGGELSYFGQEGMSEVTVGQVTFQFQCSSESTNGTGVQGGQIPELIFYGPTHDEH